jgi:hypothetical protein
MTGLIVDNFAAMQTELFSVDRQRPEQIIAKALERKPVAIFALFSGGDGSLAGTHWAMSNVPGCRVAHIDTGIGIPQSREFVQETCKREGWDLTVIRAKEDCGQDYDQIVLERGFPGPPSHRFMYIQLKERAIEELVRRNKVYRSSQKVMLLTGITHDDSVRRSGYGNDVIKLNKSQLWVNHMYYMGKTWMHHYVHDAGIPRSPVSEIFGMSGECCCGAYAEEGELAAIRLICPALADRIERLEERVWERGHHWRWEGRPPKERDTFTPDMFDLPMCRGCLKEQLRRAA